MDTVNASTLKDIGVLNTKSAAPQNKSDQLGQSDFLKLMITQFKNQDPLKPMENGDFVAQMASFGTVSGIQDLQKSLAGLVSSLQSDQSLQASSLIGRTVQVPTNSLDYQAGGIVTGAIDVPASSSAVTITIKDETGVIITQLEYGSTQAGMLDFSWDGATINGDSMPSGTYNIEAEVNYDNKTYSAQAYANSKVDSITLGTGNKDLVLNLDNGREYAFNQVRRIM